MASPHREASSLPPSAIVRLQELATARLGLENRPGKELLFSVRTARHMRELGIQDPAEYMRVIENDSSGETLQGLLDLLTTNHTAFWREPDHFEWLQDQLRQWKAGAKQTIWCAASSSGEEPYTLAMVAREAMGPAAPERVQILATDVSTRMLDTARAGIFDQDRIQTLPEAWQRHYFEPGKGAWQGRSRVKSEIRQMVHFRWLNLVEPFPQMGPFPVIFCRNVMIYFSQETRMQIVQKLVQRLTPGGYLLVGHAEGLSGLEADTDYVRPAVYRRRPGMRAAATQGGERWV
ncbi:MAG TPA: protein-glutamate O-methyltransferase CheR [Bryobacteraceae bacterium]|nr:protein-glutamate O-methyltransferase CheR [Bryobacteraceae bacterium]